MRMRLFLIVAVLLASAALYGQDYPQTSGETNPNQTNTPNCSDPLMAASSLCASDLNSAGLRSGFSGTGLGTGVPSPQQPTVTTYTDERNSSGNREKGTMVTLPPEPLTEFQKFTAATTGIVLPIFGASLFQNVPSTFAPLENVPVPPDYVVGPDDELRLRVWGQVNFNANLQVDRSGNVYVPNVGAVHVAGERFSELDQTLRAAVGKVYRNFDLSVQLGQFRAIQIYVTGEARRPGVYTVSALSTLVDALFASGGPSVQGSMRHIELRRGGTAATTFDLYRLLIEGDKSKDTKLLPGDVIYIPPVGPEIAVLGSVRRAAIYEMLPGDTVAEAIRDAGNLSSFASDARASLERNVEHSGRQAMEVRLDAAGMATPVQDGDFLHVISIVSKFQKTVTLRGNTANPGRFAWHEGMKLTDLIPDRDSLITRDYWWKRVSLGLPAPEFQPVPALSAMRQPTIPVDLSMLHRLESRTATANAQQPANNNAGQNQRQAQGGTESSNGETSQSPAANDLYTPLNEAIGGTAGQNQRTAEGNALVQQEPRASQSALAEEQAEATESMTPPAARRTVVKLSVPEIDWSYAVIERMDPDTLKTKLIPFDLGKLVLQHDATQDLQLQAGDIVSIFSQSDIHVPIAEQTGLVRLEGEFVHAGTYSVLPGETLRSLVERAGGLTPNAYLYGSVFTRESARVIQQRRMDETVQSMMLEMQRGNLALAASPVTHASDLAGISAAEASERELITRLQQVRATGRVVFSFKPDSRGFETIPEVPLENGDSFLVPSVPSTVNAVGAIFNQNSFLYRPDGRVESYLQLSGGPNSNADRKRMFIVRANGAVVSRESVKGAWGNEFFHLRLNPGDTLVVPDKTIKPSALRGFLDWTQIFSQLMFGVAAANVVF